MTETSDEDDDDNYDDDFSLDLIQRAASAYVLYSRTSLPVTANYK